MTNILANERFPLATSCDLALTYTMLLWQSDIERVASDLAAGRQHVARVSALLCHGHEYPADGQGPTVSASLLATTR